MSLLSEKDTQYLRGEFAKLGNTVKLILFLQEEECPSCDDARTLLEEAASLSEKLELVTYNITRDKAQAAAYNVDTAPTVAIEGTADYGIRFRGTPSGYEFSSLVEDIIDVGSGGDTSLSAETRDALSRLKGPVHIQVFVTPSCPYCPRAVRTAHMMAMASDKVTADMVMANEFPELSSRYNVMAVPKIVLNDDLSFEGSIPEEDYITFVTKAAG